MSSNFKSVFLFDVSKVIDPEYIPYLEDLSRMLIIQFIIQFMYFSKNPSSHSFFTLDFIELCLYIIIAVSVYWLVFKKLVKLT